MLYAQDSENLKEGKHLLLKRTPKTVGTAADRTAVIEKVRSRGGRPVIKLEGVDDRNASEELRGMEIYLEETELEELPEGEHYVRDIIGYTVVDIASTNDSASAFASSWGTEIGVLTDVIQNTAQSILEVSREEGRPVLIPAVDEFLKNIDDENKVIEVELIPGFLE